MGGVFSRRPDCVRDFMLTAASDMLVIANERKAADALVIPFPDVRNNIPASRAPACG